MTKQKAVIFDIDETLISARQRRLESFRRIPTLPSFQKIPNINCLSTLQRKDIRSYDLTKPMEKCNIPEKYHDRIQKRWKRNFSSNNIVYEEDGDLIEKPLKGAMETVNAFHDKGYHIIYMTGRYDINKRKSMRWGTLDELVSYKFPLTKNTTLVMKDAHVPNHTYKRKVSKKLKKKYNVKAIFDDLPNNLKSMSEVFPNAKLYGLTRRSRCSDYPKGTVCIKNFENFSTTSVL